MNIIIFGPPGAGKGTQSDKIVEDYKMFKLSTGDLLRAEIKEQSELGKNIEKIVNAGKLVSKLKHQSFGLSLEVANSLAAFTAESGNPSISIESVKIDMPLA